MKRNLLKYIVSASITAATVCSLAQSPIELPTMGWSSWNTYRVDISDSLIIRQADAMANLGLKEAGYTYINIDDGYFGGRDTLTGRLKIHPTRFPGGLKTVVDHIHSLGLKAGIYSDAGANTCGSWYDKDSIAVGVGLYGHEQQDCNMFFNELGFDFIKVDFCGGRSQSNATRLGLDPRERYTAIHEAILNTGRKDVRLNVCRWDYPGTWVAEVASSWRMSRDISCRWDVVKLIIEQNLYLSAYAGNGHYNDMDMLEVGRTLTAEEDRTHFAIWCMMASPLLIGCDMTTLDDQTLALLTNRNLIAIDQDTLGLQAYVVKHDPNAGGSYVLVKDLVERNGLTRAVALYNPSDAEKTISITCEELEMGGVVEAEDLFEKHSRNVMRSNGLLSSNVPAHGTKVFRLTATQRLPRVRYEAETAYLTCYQELCNPYSVGTAYYEKDSLASGGMIAANLGGRALNDLQWRNVWCQADGEYKVVIRCATFSDGAALLVSANSGIGQRFTAEQAKDGFVTLKLRLRKGRNTVRLYNDCGPMPDIDYMNIRS